ncbi:MAG TPA: hypothetical protein VFI11_13185 [Anaerolineales bacterium]|nr:hypothetical protein [Anaerolineales bacterium]
MPDVEKITIIEGPPPTFEIVGDGWLLGLAEGAAPSQVAVCRLRTLNGPALVERCYRAWRDGQAMHLEYRSDDGLTQQAPVVAARWTHLDEGHVLTLWVRIDIDDVEVDIDFDEDEDEPDDAGFDLTS